MEGDSLGLATTTVEADDGDDVSVFVVVGRDASTWVGEGSADTFGRDGERPRRLFFRKIRS